jgi:hypothetical protein
MILLLQYELYRRKIIWIETIETNGLAVLIETILLETIINQEKCIKQHVLNVKNLVKYLLNQGKIDQFFVKNVT